MKNRKCKSLLHTEGNWGRTDGPCCIVIFFAVVEPASQVLFCFAQGFFLLIRDFFPYYCRPRFVLRGSQAWVFCKSCFVTILYCKKNYTNKVEFIVIGQ